MSRLEIPQEAIDRARNADVIGVAESLGAVFKANPEAGIPCPGCGGRDRFAVSRSKNVFSCRASGEGGDAIRLVRHILGCGFAEAIEILTGRNLLPCAARRQQPPLGRKTIPIARKHGGQHTASGARRAGRAMCCAAISPCAGLRPIRLPYRHCARSMRIPTGPGRKNSSALSNWVRRLP